MRPNICTLILTVSVLIGVVVFPHSAFSQGPEHHYYWVAGSGDWSTAENWQHQEWDPELEQYVWVLGVPDSDDWVHISNGGTANITSNANALNLEVESSGLLLAQSASLFLEALLVNADGLVTQTGGIADLSTPGPLVRCLELGTTVGSQGAYNLEDGELYTRDVVHVGAQGRGSFTQSGGLFENNEHLVLGRSAGSQGSYSLIEGTLSADRLTVGYEGTGTFIQTSGTIDVSIRLAVGHDPGSNGSYEMLGGTLNVAGDIEVGPEGGTGSFVVNGGTINGTTGDAELSVCGSRGSLTGQGTFNIEVSYQSDDIFGTYGEEAVCITFGRNCLTAGGAYNVNWMTPSNFAGGIVPYHLLESSVFDIGFNGTHCGEFAIAIPYDQAEVDAYDANELELLVLRETGPKAYETLSIAEIDTYDNVIYVIASSFGKYAIAVDLNGGGGGGCCVPWYLGDLDHDCNVDFDDLAKLARYWLEEESSVDIAPIGGDRIINFKDFAVLAGNWLKCTTP